MSQGSDIGIVIGGCPTAAAGISGPRLYMALHQGSFIFGRSRFLHPSEVLHYRAAVQAPLPGCGPYLRNGQHSVWAYALLSRCGKRELLVRGRLADDDTFLSVLSAVHPTYL